MIARCTSNVKKIIKWFYFANTFRDKNIISFTVNFEISNSSIQKICVRCSTTLDFTCEDGSPIKISNNKRETKYNEIIILCNVKILLKKRIGQWNRYEIN